MKETVDKTGSKPLSIDELKPSDRKNGYPLNVPLWYTKTFEKVPALITWSLLLAPVVFSLLGYPEVIVAYVAFMVIYWSQRGLVFFYGIVVGYRRYKRDIAEDWVGKIADLKDPREMKYVYICPMVKEGWHTLKPAIEMFAKQDIGAEKITIIFALEERFTQFSMPVVERLIERYKGKFHQMSYNIHPYGIPGEVSGVKGANINWATRHFVRSITEKGENLEDYLLITCDSDLRPHEKYLSAITYKYLIAEDPLKTFFSTAVHTFNNNIWRVPVLNRVFANSLMLAMLQAWVTRKEYRDTWSSYVVNLKTVHDVGYWDPEVGIDDTTFYWNASIRFNGEFRGEEVYVPTYNDAVENETFIKSHQALYKQQLRWGWGIIVFPITMAGFYKNNEIPTLNKIYMFMKLFHNQLLFLTVVYTITFATPIMSLLSPEFQYSSASHNLARIMSIILSSLMLLYIPTYIIRKKLVKSPDEWSLWRKGWDSIEIFLMTVNMLTFGFLPRVQAQTEMLLNRFRKKYYATDKVIMSRSIVKDSPPS